MPPYYAIVHIIALTRLHTDRTAYSAATDAVHLKSMKRLQRMQVRVTTVHGLTCQQCAAVHVLQHSICVNCMKYTVATTGSSDAKYCSTSIAIGAAAVKHAFAWSRPKFCLICSSSIVLQNDSASERPQHKHCKRHTYTCAVLQLKQAVACELHNEAAILLSSR
eukprot:10094-Heterococcus_DN1.PRE.1